MIDLTYGLNQCKYIHGTVRYCMVQYGTIPVRYGECLVFTLIKTISQIYHTMTHLDHLDERLASSGIKAQDAQNSLRKNKVQPRR